MASADETRAAREKISPVFAARLEQLGPDERVRAVVVLRAAGSQSGRRKRLSAEERAAAVRGVRRSLEEILPDIDRILESHGGRRLKSEMNALGAVPVVATAEGINALTASEHVKAVFEDQAIRGAA